MGMSFNRCWFSVAALTLAAAADLQAATPAVQCGALIVESLTLKEDLGPCPGDGLVVGSSDIQIDLNGHRVFATQRANVGVRLEGWSNVTVKGGVIAGFDNGVLVTGGQGHTLTHLTLRNNRFGLRVADAPASAHRIEKNVVTANRLIGVLFDPLAVGATLSKNDVSANAGFGIVLDGGSSSNSVEGNRAVGNRDNDVELRRGGSNDLLENHAPAVLDLIDPDRAPYVEGVDFHAAGGIGDVVGRLKPAGIALAAATAQANPNPSDTSTSGCSTADFDAADFRQGDIALLQRGGCELKQKVERAIGRGAAAVIIFNEGQAPHRLTHDFGSAAELIVPVVFASYAAGFELHGLASNAPVTVRVTTHTSLVPLTGGFPGAHDNEISKNVAGTATDQNFCTTNRWTKNDFQSFFVGSCPGGGGIGATSHNY
jgi:parallel beta-helix repeat protein